MLARAVEDHHGRLLALARIYRKYARHVLRSQVVVNAKKIVDLVEVHVKLERVSLGVYEGVGANRGLPCDRKRR